MVRVLEISGFIGGRRSQRETRVCERPNSNAVTSTECHWRTTYWARLDAEYSGQSEIPPLKNLD